MFGTEGGSARWRAERGILLTFAIWLFGVLKCLGEFVGGGFCWLCGVRIGVILCRVGNVCFDGEIFRFDNSR